jgi:hypothetical protein
MSELILTDGTSSLQIDLANWDGDAYIAVSINSRGFTGKTDLYILEEEFRGFCKSFVDLQKTLKGEATLKSISPNELELVIKPYDALGHFSVAGKIGHHFYTTYGYNWHSVEFGFEINPSELDKGIRTDWIYVYLQGFLRPKCST